MGERLVEVLFTEINKRLERIRSGQMEAIDRASDAILQATDGGKRTYVFGSGHSASLAQELCLRAGGMPIFVPLYIPGLLATDFPYLFCAHMERLAGVGRAVLDTARIAPGDVLIIISASGRNQVAVEMATEASHRQVLVVAVTGLEFSHDVSSRHPSGLRLFEVADVVIDSGCPPGDAAVPIPNSPSTGPLSTILGATVLQALVCRLAERYLDRGEAPPIFVSGNVDGGDEYGRELLERFWAATSRVEGIRL